MSWDPTPWMVGGGALHGAEVGRLLAYAALRGAEGIVTPGDLKVVPYSTPGTGVRVLAGAAAILNRSPGGGQQTYIGRNSTEDVVSDIAATTSAGGRSDLIVARVRDPQYPGTPAPADPRTAQYIETHRIPNVSPATTTAAELNLNYPAIALARIDLPASTGTILASHIVDLRQLALAREHREVFVNPLADESLLARTSYTDWGSYRPVVRVPSWATHATMIVTLSGIVVQGGNITGYLRTMFGAIPSVGVGYDENLTSDQIASSNGSGRQMFMIAFGADVRQYQGQNVTVKVQGFRDNAGENGYLRAYGSSSHIAYDIHFDERAF